MGIPYPLRVWKLGQAVAKNDKIANLKNWGILPHELRHKKAIMPVLMHGKKITFGDNVSELGNNHTRRAFIPNVLFKPLYSRGVLSIISALDMFVWTCVSASALREIDSFGGFDEYITRVSANKNMADPNGKYQQSKMMMVEKVKEKYGSDYAQQVFNA